MKIVNALIGLLITMPIWYLLHSILIAIHADSLMMFLFWIYIPSGVLVTIMQKLIEMEAKKK